MPTSKQTDGGEAPIFRLALSMSGAISAGAYTAGVFDFLIRALHEWELHRNGGHRAVITALTGASAGGIVSALGPVALGHGLQPTRYRTSWGGEIDCLLPDLYEAWVVRPDMLPPGPGMPGFLTCEDLADRTLRALLNGKVLDDIRDYVLRPVAATAQAYPYIARDLHLYLTITNLAGIPYSIVSANDDPYCMVSHGDRLHYVIADLGLEQGLGSLWAEKDTITREAALRVEDLRVPSPDWRTLGDAALATSAFPVGLPPRLTEAAQSDYEGQPPGSRPPARIRQWPAAVSPGADIVPGPPSAWPPGTGAELAFATADGGVINNDPFDYARYCLFDDRGPVPLDHNPRDPIIADRAVLMISPFPAGQISGDLYAQKGAITLIAALKRLLPTLIDQARFKLTDLAAAADDSVASRWLISPRRTPMGPTSSAYIACGLLGGFGGFLDRSFREHDFQLGQRNCQQFLRNWFALPPANPVVAKTDHPPISSEARTTKQGQRRIIPLMGKAVDEIPEPPWPRIGKAELDRLVAGIRGRAAGLLTELPRSWILRLLAKWVAYPIFLLVWWLCLRDPLRLSLKKALVDRDQWKG